MNGMNPQGNGFPGFRAPQQQPQRGFGPAPQQSPHAAPQQAPQTPQFGQQAQRPGFRGAPQQGFQQPQQQQRQPAQALRPNPFAGIAQARAQTEKNYEECGGYVERIDSVTWIVGYNDGLNKVIIKKTVLGVTVPNAQGRTHSVGEQISHVIVENLKYDYFLPEVKAFIANVVGCPQEAVDDVMCQEIFNPAANPLGGLVVEVMNNPKMSGSGKLLAIKNYKRRIRSAEIQQILAPEVVARFFPGDTLARMAAGEAQEAAQQAAREAEQAQNVQHVTQGTAGYPQGGMLPPPPQGNYPAGQSYQQ